MLQRGYIILIIGGALLISGIVISALWAESFAGPFIRENTILNGVSIRPSGLVNTTIQVSDTSRPVSLAIHVERNNNASGNGGNGLGGEEQISNNTPKYDSFFLKNEEGKVKELWGCLADIHTLLHMPIELFRHASNNNTKADTTTDTKQAVDFAEA